MGPILEQYIATFINRYDNGTVEDFLRHLRMNHKSTLSDVVSVIEGYVSEGLIKLENPVKPTRTLYTNMIIRPTFKGLWVAYRHAQI